jgi:hypothetical protein
LKLTNPLVFTRLFGLLCLLNSRHVLCANELKDALAFVANPVSMAVALEITTFLVAAAGTAGPRSLRVEATASALCQLQLLLPAESLPAG